MRSQFVRFAIFFLPIRSKTTTNHEIFLWSRWSIVNIPRYSERSHRNTPEPPKNSEIAQSVWKILQKQGTNQHTKQFWPLLKKIRDASKKLLWFCGFMHYFLRRFRWKLKKLMYLKYSVSFRSFRNSCSANSQ